MKRHSCPACHQEIFPHNTACLACGAELVFDPRAGAFAVLAQLDTGQDPGQSRGGCANRTAISCNWRAESPGGLCLSCAHTTVVPDLGVPGNPARWERIETAKRPLIEMLLRLGLPLRAPDGSPTPRFELKGDPVDAASPRVLTGHADGTITLNIAEADDAERARIRTAMQEPYRTLAGHFRHEIAHHYWTILTAADPARLGPLRAVFGDERADYAAALQAHYAQGPAPDWQGAYISAYASAHPAEDFAETWAHVFHMLDGLETACAFGLWPGPQQGPAPDATPAGIEALVTRPMADLARDWVALSVALNAVNAAMGHDSFYPFVLSAPVIDKLDAVRALIAAAGTRDPAHL